MEFKVLGRTRASVDGESVDLGTSKQRALLAVLLVADRESVPQDRIVSALWGEASPTVGVNRLQAYVSRLRKALYPSAFINRIGDGYELRCDSMTLDLHRFRDLVSHARSAADDAAVEMLKEALVLWDGRPLADVDSAWAADLRARLEDERFEAEIFLAETESKLGRYEGVLRRIDSWSAERRTDERLASMRMRALRDLGRYSEALSYYSGFSRLVAERFGSAPGDDVRRVFEEITGARSGHRVRSSIATGSGTVVQAGVISGDVVVHRPQPARRPQQLPPTASPFIDRGSKMEDLLGHLSLDNGVPITVVTGMPGVGKTVLAVQAAHEADRRGWFPGGILHASFDRSADPGAKAVEIIRSFVRALGIPSGTAPVEDEALIALYRSLLPRSTDRRLLIVLEDVEFIDRIGPLLSSSPATSLLITSRARSSSAPFAQYVELAPLDRTAGTGFLRERYWPDAPLEDLEALVDLCGGLPLALQLVISHAAARHLTAGEVVAQLSADLSTGTTTTAAVFAEAYAVLDQRIARVFRLMSTVALPTISPDAVSALAGIQPHDAVGVLDQLAGLHLIEAAEAPAGHYSMHDLLLEYARSLSSEHDGPEVRSRAVTDLLDDYLRRFREVELAVQIGFGGLQATTRDDRDAALIWAQSERGNVLPLLRLADRCGLVDIARDLVRALYPTYAAECWWDDLVELQRLVLDLVERAGDLSGQVMLHGNLGNVYLEQDRLGEAITHYERALRLHGGLADRHGEATVISNLGRALHESGQHDRAVSEHRRALTMFREIGDTAGEAAALTNLGATYRELGRTNEAVQVHHRALDLYREVGDRPGEAAVLANLGMTHRNTDHLDEALTAYRRALSIYRQLEDGASQSAMLDSLGAVLRLMGSGEHALSSYGVAIDVHRRAQQALDASILDQVVAYSTTREGARHWRAVVAEMNRALTVIGLRDHVGRDSTVDRSVVVDLLTLAQDVADDHDDLAIALDDWLDAARRAARSANPGVTNVVSGTVRGTVVQGRDLSGPALPDLGPES